MSIKSCGRVGMAAVLGLVVAAGSATAGNNPNGSVFTAVGFFKGEAQVSEDSITCEVPTMSTAIYDGFFAMGLWNTYGEQTLLFPNPNSAFGNPCGGWVQLRNNLFDQGITIERFEARYRIPIARRFRQFVPTFRQFPIACRPLRKDWYYVGGRVEPANSTLNSSGSGAPNVAFLEMLPMVTPQMFHCLRDQYASMPTDMLVSMPLVVKVRAHGTSDSGAAFRSNWIQYTLNLRHTCGNGRLDDGETCDATAPNNTCGSGCIGGVCALNTSRACVSAADCGGTCIGDGGPSECTCQF
jgi:hypothetical protein